MKNTIIIEIDAKNIDDRLIEQCAKILREGGIVAFPTETVYGLGADALNSEAVKSIFVAKGRPSDNPLIIHISQTKDILPLVKEIPEKAYEIMEEFWPGPLTLIFKRNDIVPHETSGGLPTVAIRIPNHPIAIRLIEKSGIPIAAPSANISGGVSPTEAEHVIKDLMGKVDAIIVGGDCNVGIESTVLDITGQVPVVLRQGVITRKMLENVLKEAVVDLSAENSNKIREGFHSPGIKYTHYSPSAEMIIVQGNLENMVTKINELKIKHGKEGKKIGIICTDETKNRYEENAEEIKNGYEGIAGKVIIKSLGSREHPETIAANLFRTLRGFDKTDVEIILCESVDDAEIGQAIMDRLKKASGNHIIRV